MNRNPSSQTGNHDTLLGQLLHDGETTILSRWQRLRTGGAAHLASDDIAWGHQRLLELRRLLAMPSPHASYSLDRATSDPTSTVGDEPRPPDASSARSPAGSDDLCTLGVAILQTLSDANYAVRVEDLHALTLLLQGEAMPNPNVAPSYALSDFLTDLCHDIANPVAAMQMSLSLALRRLQAGASIDVEQTLRSVARASVRATWVVHDIEMFRDLLSPPPNFGAARYPLAELLEEAYERIYPYLELQRVQVEVEVANATCDLHCHRPHFVVLLCSLFRYFVKRMGADLRAVLRVSDADDGADLDIDLVQEAEDGAGSTPGVPRSPAAPAASSVMSTIGFDDDERGIILANLQAVLRTQNGSLRRWQRGETLCGYGLTLPKNWRPPAP